MNLFVFPAETDIKVREEYIKTKVSDEYSVSSSHNSINEAVSSATKGDRIYVFPSVYYEQVVINKSNIAIMGDNAESTVISGNLCANEILEDGQKRGTFRTYSVLLNADDVTISNITIENTAGGGPDIGQAIALYADGDRIKLLNCFLKGRQDTLFTGPLPLKEAIPGGFRGPLEHAPRINGRHWYKDCYIEGDVDFIFGSATAIFEDCTIVSLNRNKEINGYIAAPSTPEKQTYGYVFRNCEFIGRDCAKESVYLARPWRECAKAVFVNCKYGEHIIKEGFSDWKKIRAHESSFFAEYPTVDGRVSWTHIIDDPEKYLVLSVENIER